MAAFDAHKNFAYSLVATAPSPASSGTSLVVTAGQGSSFPAVPFNAVVCPAGSLPTAANAEILRVTTIATDTMTIVRAQEGSSARTIVVGDQIFAAATAKTFTDIESLLAAVASPTTTGNITSLALPGGLGDQVTRMNNASLATIQGMAAGLYVGQRWRIISIGAGQVDLSHQDGAATGAKLSNWVTSGKTSLAPGKGTAEFIYDGTNWVLVDHEQGAWLTRTFAAGNYTGGGAMTWTVTSGETTADHFYLRGRTLFYSFNVAASTVGGTPSVKLQITLPGGYTATIISTMPFNFITNGAGTSGTGMAQVGVSGTAVQLYLDAWGSTNWTAGAAVYVEGTIMLPVN